MCMKKSKKTDTLSIHQFIKALDVVVALLSRTIDLWLSHEVGSKLGGDILEVFGPWHHAQGHLRHGNGQEALSGDLLDNLCTNFNAFITARELRGYYDRIPVSRCT